MKSFTINSATELPYVAQELIKFAQNDKFFTFEGEMAAGKTTFIKAFCEALEIEDIVSSPTFSIVNEYESKVGPVYHFDFYRLKSPQEAYDIGYEEYFYSGNYCLVEWPTKVEDLLPKNYTEVVIEIIGAEQRKFTFNKIDN